MSDIVSNARSARESLAKGLNLLQANPNAPPDYLQAAEPIATAMGALHRIEKEGAAALKPSATEALDAVRAALSILQAKAAADPHMMQTMEAVASSLGTIFGLTKSAELVAAPQPVQQAPYQPPAQQPYQPPVQQASYQPPVQQPYQPPQQAPYQPPVQQPYQPPVQQAPYQPPVQQAPYQPPVQQAPHQPPVQQAPYQPPVQQAPYQPPVQQAPYQPPVQQAPYQPPPAQAYQPPVQQAPYQPPPQVQPQQPYAPPQPPAAQPIQAQPAYAPAPVPAYAPPPQPQGGFKPPGVAAPAAPNPAPAGGWSESDPFAAPAAAAAPVASPDAYRGGADVPIIEAELGTHSVTNFYRGLSGNDVVDHGGLFVATYNVPHVGQTLKVQVSLPGGYEFEAIGVVRWTRESRESMTSDVSPPGCGIQFTHIAPEARQLVYRYVRNREPLFHDDL